MSPLLVAAAAVIVALFTSAVAALALLWGRLERRTARTAKARAARDAAEQVDQAYGLLYLAQEHLAETETELAEAQFQLAAAVEMLSTDLRALPRSPGKD